VSWTNLSFLLIVVTHNLYLSHGYRTDARLHSGNFIDLINQKFYDGLYIHRIVPEYCIQFGCPFAKNPHVYYGTLDEDAGQGSGPPDTTFKSCTGKDHTRDEYGNVEDEIVKGLSNEEKTLSMANSGDPDTNGSQFFINLVDNKRLDWWNGSSESAHPVFGKVRACNSCIGIEINYKADEFLIVIATTDHKWLGYCEKD
jgi:cyclophilin family peptidyl-prolyl cis-trans isomerase